MSRTPTTILTGFLGSGKTTIIAHLLDDLSALGEKCVYIKNEVGDISTDGLILQQHSSQLSGVRELTNGCICCTLTGQLYHAVTELINTYHPDRLLIESAGTAKPHDLALAVSEHPLLLRDGLICVIDVVNFNGYDRVDSVAQRQAAFTDVLLFNKIELVDMERLRSVVAYVREVNHEAPILEAPHGRAPVAAVCGVSPKAIVSPGHSEEAHTEGDGIEGVVVHPTGQWSTELLQKVVAQLPKTVFRVKGVLSLDGQKYIVNAVCGRLVTEVYTGTAPEQLTLIGYHLTEQEDSLRGLWSL